MVDPRSKACQALGEGSTTLVKPIDSLENKALDIIKNNKGILQSDLWKMLGLDSREGSRVVLRLVKKGLVKRRPVIINGRKTYRLYPVEITEMASIIIDLVSILDIPCTVCPYIDQCGPGNYYDPASCTLMSEWLRRTAIKEREDRGSGSSGERVGAAFIEGLGGQPSSAG